MTETQDLPVTTDERIEQRQSAIRAASRALAEPTEEVSLYVRIGWQIKQQRARFGWSQAELGARLTPPRTHAAISDIERAKTKPDLDELRMIARALGMPLAWLLRSVT